MAETTMRTCTDCAARGCDKADAQHPDFCVSEALDSAWLADVVALYGDEQNKRVAIASATVERDGHGTKTRVEETIEFAKRIGAKKIGIATCVGLLKESRVLARLLRANGFDVYGIGCKVGEVPKTSIGAPLRCEQTGRNMCNPIAQAMLLNDEHTDLNIVMGLCVGHDSLFYRYSEAITTTLVVKDRVLVHNPVAALYAADGVYRRKLEATTGPFDPAEKTGE